MMKNKIQTRQAIVTICQYLKGQGKTIGFTSGAFDLLHAGHADYLEKAKAICDVLIVGVNTDESVRSYKGEDRPIIPENHRTQLVAALESVDYVFLFNERRNAANIEAIKPDYYIKAGDYNASQLTSKEIVEQYGGGVRLIPVEEVISSSSIIEKIRENLSLQKELVVEKEGTVHFKRKSIKASPAVFVDRDGTINEDVLYLHDPKEFKLLPNAAEGLKQFQDMGYRIIIMTNQPGIGIGYFRESAFYAVNREMLKVLSKHSILIDKIYFCPHSKSEQCDCRKPGQALVKLAIDELSLDLSNSYFIGDKTSDLETGRRAGMKTIALATGFGCKDGEFSDKSDVSALDLLDAAKKVLSVERN